MTGKTHIIGGIAATVVVAHLDTYEPTFLVIAGVLGSVLPDICHSGSKIGRKFPFVSKWINTIFGHRTFTHSLLFLALIGYILSLVTENQSFIIGFLIGMASHFVLDAATKKGIKLFYPVPFSIRLPITMRTGGKGETIVMFLLILITLFYAKDIIL